MKPFYANVYVTLDDECQTIEACETREQAVNGVAGHITLSETGKDDAFYEHTIVFDGQKYLEPICLYNEGWHLADHERIEEHKEAIRDSLRPFDSSKLFEDFTKIARGGF